MGSCPISFLASRDVQVIFAGNMDGMWGTVWIDIHKENTFFNVQICLWFYKPKIQRYKYLKLYIQKITRFQSFSLLFNPIHSYTIIFVLIPIRSCSILFFLIFSLVFLILFNHICFLCIFKTFQSYSSLFIPIHSYLFLFIPVQFYSNLFNPNLPYSFLYLFDHIHFYYLLNIFNPICYYSFLYIPIQSYPFLLILFSSQSYSILFITIQSYSFLYIPIRFHTNSILFIYSILLFSLSHVYLILFNLIYSYS